MSPGDGEWQKESAENASPMMPEAMVLCFIRRKDYGRYSEEDRRLRSGEAFPAALLAFRAACSLGSFSFVRFDQVFGLERETVPYPS